MQIIAPFLWFDTKAEEAANYYINIFPNSKIIQKTYYRKNWPGPEGQLMSISFLLNGQEFGAINGGPQFKFTEAISLAVYCENQEEVDKYWGLLSEEGEEGQCGWLKDKYGLSWQIVPRILDDLIADPSSEKADRVMMAMLEMKKIEIEPLMKAYNGEN